MKRIFSKSFFFWPPFCSSQSIKLHFRFDLKRARWGPRESSTVTSKAENVFVGFPSIQLLCCCCSGVNLTHLKLFKDVRSMDAKMQEAIGGISLHCKPFYNDTCHEVKRKRQKWVTFKTKKYTTKMDTMPAFNSLLGGFTFGGLLLFVLFTVKLDVFLFMGTLQCCGAIFQQFEQQIATFNLKSHERVAKL